MRTIRPPKGHGVQARRTIFGVVSGRSEILVYESAVVFKEYIDAQKALIDKITFGSIP